MTGDLMPCAARAFAVYRCADDYEFDRDPVAICKTIESARAVACLYVAPSGTRVGRIYDWWWTGWRPELDSELAERWAAWVRACRKSDEAASRFMAGGKAFESTSYTREF